MTPTRDAATTPLVVAIVQARMGSTRLPGKVLRDLNGVPVLAHVVSRVRAIPGVALVCCAIPEGEADDRLSAAAEALGATVCRGPEGDVLTRYLIAARTCRARVVLRFTADCPLLDPGVSGRVLSELLLHGSDYVSNVDPRSWPRGYDTEAFTRDALERAAAEATDAYDREHVTPWMRRSSDLTRRNVALDTARCATWRWTLDYEQDLAFARNVLARLPAFPHLPRFDEIRAVVERHPEVAAMNAGVE